MAKWENDETLDNQPKQQLDDFNQRHLTIPFATVIVLLFIGRMLPEHYSWGFNYWGYFSWAVSITALGVALLLIWPPISQALVMFVGPFVSWFRQLGRWIPQPVLAGIVSILTVLILYIFRSRVLAYGDGFSVLAHVTGDGPVKLTGQHYVQVGAIMFHRYVFLLLSEFTRMSPSEIFGLTNAVGGMFGLWAIYRIIRMVVNDSVSRAFIFFGAMGSGAVIMFFGYVENYTWAFVFSLWTISFAIGYRKRKNGPLGLVVFVVLASAFHMVTLPIVIVAILSVFFKNSAQGNSLWGMPLSKISWLIITGSVVVGMLLHLFRFNLQVPMWPTDNNPYWFLSLAHLVDVFNQLIQVAPLGTALMVFNITYGRRRAAAGSEADGILGLSALLFFLLAFWLDPKIGAVRDWDLFAFYGFPLTLWATLRFTQFFRGRQVSVNWLVAVAVMVVVVVGPNLYDKNHPELAIGRLDQILSIDIHYQPQHEKARRGITWSVILQKELNRDDLAVKYLKRGIEANPQEADAYWVLGATYSRQEQFDSALKYVALAHLYKPDDLEILMTMLELECKDKRWNDVIEHAQKVLAVKPDDVEVLNILGVAFSMSGQTGESIPYFRRACQLAPQSYEYLINLGRSYASIGMLDSAQHYVGRALPLAPSKMKAKLCSILINSAIDLGRRQEAANYLRLLEQLDPRSPEISVLREKLSGLP